MGTIFKRGTRANPRFYFQYREGRLANGRPRYTIHAATGARTMEDARKQLALVETRISQPRIRCAAMGAVHDGGLGPAVASMLLEKPT